MNSSEIKLTIPFQKFLNYAIGSFEKIPIDINDALLFAELDKSEQLCHIEFPDENNNLKEPRLWWIKAWRTDYAKWCIDKARSAAERREANLYHENRMLIARAMGRKFGLSHEIFLVAASKIAKSKNTQAAAQLGIKLDL